MFGLVADQFFPSFCGTFRVSLYESRPIQTNLPDVLCLTLQTSSTIRKARNIWNEFAGWIVLTSLCVGWHHSRNLFYAGNSFFPQKYPSVHDVCNRDLRATAAWKMFVEFQAPLSSPFIVFLSAPGHSEAAILKTTLSQQGWNQDWIRSHQSGIHFGMSEPIGVYSIFLQVLFELRFQIVQILWVLLSWGFQFRPSKDSLPENCT